MAILKTRAKRKETWQCQLAGHVAERPRLGSICEECGGTGVWSASTQQEMERFGRSCWRGSVGQYSSPFRSRPPELGLIVPAIANTLLLRV
jgi:hypothetical protein